MKRSPRSLLAVLVVSAFGASPVFAVNPDSGTPTTPPELPGMKLVFFDDFSHPEFAEQWRTLNHSDYGSANLELQASMSDNVKIERDKVVITARRERATIQGGDNHGKVMDFTSGFLDTRERRYFPRFGRFEMRARVPHGQGLWPAFWLRHRDGAGVAEVDVMEYFHSTTPGKTHGKLHLDLFLKKAHEDLLDEGKPHPYTTHRPDGSERWVSNKGAGKAFEAPTTTPGWHTWAVEILPAGKDVLFKFYLNDELYYQHTNIDPEWVKRRPGEPLWDIAINLAVGGRWIGHPDDRLGYSRDLDACLYAPIQRHPLDNCDPDGTIWRAAISSVEKDQASPPAYEIDWVRVYQHQED
ncbi:MAG TPA: glycoside hydrolase family 16 protein [Pseudomonas xinjiangensis]|uniref:Glycoside hydrolase family 16 protein n=2 Tax=root TaxID=1 RepID=A0A7V1BSH0_9GAMM|nr:glycoside hydrolase family 16 protein [Halopseudomonas xinjiangensis]HEC46063.1 glycoside hydrolase family 16 protein [Halopseudomonas xinjiangensis]